MELSKYWNIFRGFIWLLVLGLVLGGVAGYFSSARQTPIYQASTKVLITYGQQINNSDYTYYSDQQLAQTYIQLLSTQPVFDAIAQRLQTNNIGGISAALIGDTSVVQVTTTNADPQLAASVANMAVTVLIEQNENLQAGKYAKTEENIQTQITQVESQITTLQTQIDQLSAKTVQDQLTQVEAQISSLQTEVSDLQIRIQNAAPTKSPYKNITPTLEPAAQEALSQDQARLAQLQPVLALYQQIYTNLVVLGQPAQTGTGTQTNADQIKSTLDLYRQIYLQLISNLEDVKLAKMQNTPNVAQLEQATVPSSPISPRPLRSAMLGAAVGFMLCVGIVFLISYLDTTIKTPEDVERELSLTVLGFIADMEVKENPQGVFVIKSPRSPISEAFRSLRTNLNYVGVDKPLKTLLVTSTGPEEGKTTIALNLAVTIARRGKKVVLIDADLRRPGVHRFLDIPNRSGLSSLFKEGINPESVCFHDFPVKDMVVITSGPLPKNPDELLDSDKMSQILDKVKSFADMVILDCPPALVTDAQVLSAKVEGILIVVQPGKTRTDAVKSTLDQFKRVGTKIVGVVLNRIPKNRGYYYGGYRYYSPYYYRGYHYYRDDADHSAKGKSSKHEHLKKTMTEKLVQKKVDQDQRMQTPTSNLNPSLTAVGIISPTVAVPSTPDLDLTRTAESLSQPTNTPTLKPTSTVPTNPHTLDSPIGTNPRFIIHRVKSGENLDLYAQEYHTTIEAIRAVNYYSPTPIWEDWLIVIPLDTTDTTNLPAFEAYMVTDKNITIEKLAQSNLVDPALLKTYNGYPDNYQLTAGEWILIPCAVLISTATP
jgi:capsular exopolysaccharide synthesis family protein